MRRLGIAVNALWPRTVIATAAIGMIDGREGRALPQAGDRRRRRARHPDPRRRVSYTGHFCIDEEVLREAGVTDFDGYAVQPGAPLLPDLFLG